MALLPFGKKGSFCMVPAYAEAPCAPIEESVEGVVVVDGTMVGAANFEGIVEEPFKVYFEKGRIVNISGGKDAKRLERLLNTLEEEAKTFAELAVNSNHKVPKILTGTRTDNSIAGHVHIGLGRNDHIGGKSKAETHLDLLLTWATLHLDGNPILENGNLKI
jgi:leucyl aminopeptidase (aminopeptidase T)